VRGGGTSDFPDTFASRSSEIYKIALRHDMLYDNCHNTQKN